MILTIRSDDDNASVGLYSADGSELAKDTWEAGRALSSTLLPKIRQLLSSQNAGWEGITGIIVFSGPGSFTGLRIGVTVANTIAYARKVSIVGASGSDWTAQGVARLANGEDDTQVVPRYGSDPHITRPDQRP